MKKIVLLLMLLVLLLIGCFKEEKEVLEGKNNEIILEKTGNKVKIISNENILGITIKVNNNDISKLNIAENVLKI